MGIQLTDINTEFKLVLYACYLPPENSPWGYDPNSFFVHLLSSLYFHCDAVLFCGDFNGRVGKAVDIVSGLDEDIPPRIYLDDVKRSHGDVLLEFIKDGRLAILNGRINPTADNFTCVSHRGRSVVDYMLLPHNCLKFCLDFKVELMSDIIDVALCTELLSNTCKIPDHSLLTVKMVNS